MPQNGLADRVNQYLEVASDYFAGWGTACLFEAMGATSQIEEGIESGTTQDYLAAMERCGDAQSNLVDLGPPLAQELEHADHDSTDLLLFLQDIDGGGGPEVARESWRPLKAILQRVLLRRGGEAKPAVAVEPRQKKRKATWLAEAMMLVRDHPDWSDAKIAKHPQVDMHPTALCREPTYQAARAIARQGRQPKGFIATDRDRVQRSVEAIDPDAD